MTSMCECGQPVKKGCKTCGNKQCVVLAKTKHAVGKKRPEHAAKMKQYAAEGKFDKWVSHKNEKINSIEFKIKRLLKHGVKFDATNEEQINKEYCLLLGRVQTTPESRKRRIVNFLMNEHYNKEDEFVLSSLSNISADDVYRMGDSDLVKTLKLANSIKSAVALRRNPTTMGSSKSSKSGWLDNLACNKQGKARVFIRSSWEKSFIEMLERHQVVWEYEPMRIVHETGVYTPDFIVDLEDCKVMIEIKGYMKDYDSYFDTHIKHALAYCEKTEMQYAYIQTSDIKCPSDIKKFILGSDHGNQNP